MIDLSRTNKYPGKCFVCGAAAPAQRGVLLHPDKLAPEIRAQAIADNPRLEKKPWWTLCNSKPCAASVVGVKAVEDSDRRAILADGTLIASGAEEFRPYKQALGGYDKEAGCWLASPHRRDRDHVVAVATRLGFEIDPTWAAYTDPRPVREAVARARAIETIREYQVVGVRRSAYAGIDDSKGCGDEPRFNRRDRMRGFVNASDPGLGKTLETLLAIHDDEALVVVCNKAALAVWPREAKRWRPGRFTKITICKGLETFEWPEGPHHLVVINYEILRSTPALIRDEIEHTTAKLDGWAGNADSKTKWHRKDIDGLRPQRDAQAEVVAGLVKATASGLAIATAQAALDKLNKQVGRQEQSLARARKRRPVTAPNCPIVAVADEVHYVENHKAQRAKKWRHLASYARRVIGLTGTPVESEPFKLWGMLTSCSANPWTFPDFLKQFNAIPRLEGGYEFDRHPPAPGSTAKGAVIVQPGVTEQIGRVVMRVTQETALPELPSITFSEIPVEISDKIRKELDELTAVHAPGLLEGELPPFSALSATLKVLAKACIPMMLSLVESYEAQSTPLVVFSANRSPIEELAKRKGWYAILSGGDDPGQVQDEFQAGEGVGVACTQAGAESMTLTRASTLIQVIPFMARKLNKQAYKRLHRFGQSGTVHVIMLVPEHVLVHHIFALLVAKDQFVDSVLAGDSTPAPHVSRFVDEPEDTWRARAQAKRESDAAREQVTRTRELLARERELVKLASREVSPKLSESRAKVRAERLGPEALHRGVDAATVRAALDFMLMRCDGAVTRDAAGFNQPDSCVARWLAPGVHKCTEYALASTAAILRRYPRQLAEQWPGLFK